MATIISHPADINFSRNLPEFVLSSTKDISFELRDGDTVILEQSYTPGPDNLVHIDLRDIVHSRLFFTINEQDFAYEQRGIRRVFSAVIDGAVTVGFTVVRGGVDNLPTTVSDFLKSNFLTWQPQVKKVTYYSPEYLTYCPLGSCKLIIEAHYPDGATLTNEYNLNPSVVTTFNMNYARIKALFGNDFPAYYDAYVVDASGARISYIQRYTASSLLSEDEDWILFENSLGGLDTIRAYGAMELTSSHEHNIAEIADEKTEYRIDTERKHKKNTGYLDTRQRRWLLDFFPSQGKYIYTCGLFRRIVVTESEAVYKTNELPSEYTFTFSFADQTPLLYIPRVDTLPPELEIKAPDHGSFTLPPRLIEFPQINLGEGALFPVQAPNSDYWSAVTIGALKEYLGLSGISGTFITREEVVRMINDIDINKITLEQCEAIVKTISYTKSQSDGKYINKTGDASNATAAFVEATADAEITSGSTLSVLFGQTKRTFTSLWASLSGKLGKTEKAASAATADRATADADGKDIRTTYLPRRDKQTLDTDVNTLWAVGSSVVLSHVNTPRTDTYYLVSTFGTNGSDSAQIAIPRSGGPAYYRGFNANNNTWTSWEQIRRINDKVTTSDIADAAITAPKLSSDLTLPGTPQVGTPSGLNGASQNVATIGNVNAAVDAVQIGGTNIYRDTLGTSDFYLSATGEMKYRRFLDITPEAKRNLRGQSITVSFDYILENAVVGRGDTGFGFFVKYTDGTTTYVNAFIPAETTAVTKSGRFSVTTKIEDKEIDNITSFQPFIYAQTTSGTATVGRPKFEIGTKATQWSPAPQEMARKSDLPTVTLSATAPANPKDGDIWIVPLS